MTPNTTATRTPQVADTAAVERLLRDAAFVLRLTRRVKDDILRDCPQPRRSAATATAAECAPATLLV